MGDSGWFQFERTKMTFLSSALEPRTLTMTERQILAKALVLAIRVDRLSVKLMANQSFMELSPGASSVLDEMRPASLPRSPIISTGSSTPWPHLDNNKRMKSIKDNYLS